MFSAIKRSVHLEGLCDECAFVSMDVCKFQANGLGLRFIWMRRLKYTYGQTLLELSLFLI